jgi:O-antigen ligase
MIWLPVGLLLLPLSTDANGMNVPFTTVSVLSHKPGNAAIAALLALGCIWLFPEVWSARSRVLWTILALVTIALAATQNRGGLLGVAAGAMLAVAFFRDPLRLIARAVMAVALGLSIAVLMPFRMPIEGVQGRDYSPSQLIANVVSLGGAETPGNLGGTVRGREELWGKILDKQIRDNHLVDGSGFGQNLATEVGVYDEGKDSLRSPHNSHLHIMARMGLLGIGIWLAVWLAWYWQMVKGCRRLMREGLRIDGHIGVLCMALTTAVLVSSIFDPQLEGPQIAALLWTAFGIGIAVTSSRAWRRNGPVTSAAARFRA